MPRDDSERLVHEVKVEEGLELTAGSSVVKHGGCGSPPRNLVCAGRAIKDNLMKYTGFGYLDTKKWATLSVNEQNAAIDECFTYDEDVLRKNGH